MKKLVSAALCLAVCCSLFGCGRDSASVGIIGGADGPTAILISDQAVSDFAGCAIGIDGVMYRCTGNAVPVEPDESVVEYVEIPCGGDASVSAYAMLENGSLMVCRIDSEWYEFEAWIDEGTHLAPEDFSRP